MQSNTGNPLSFGQFSKRSDLKEEQQGSLTQGLAWYLEVGEGTEPQDVGEFHWKLSRKAASDWQCWEPELEPGGWDLQELKGSSEP